MADAKILATIERSETEQLQISLSEYKGTSYLNMRIFFTILRISSFFCPRSFILNITHKVKPPYYTSSNNNNIELLIKGNLFK